MRGRRVPRCSLALALAATACAGAGEPLYPQPSESVEGFVIGCPSPDNEFERSKTFTDAAAVLSLVEVFAFCGDETITHGEDRELQKRLQLQEQLERIDRARRKQAEREARAAREAEAARAAAQRPPRAN